MGHLKKPTIDDVAILAGVGRTSVSRVLNNGPNVRPELREKVLNAVKSLNFKVNQQARTLARGSTKSIGLINASDFDTEPNSYYSAALEIGALRAATEFGYQIQNHTINQNSKNILRDIRDIIINNSYCGIILSPPFCDNIEIIEMARENDCEVALISAGSVNKGFAPNICIDEEAAGFEIAKLLIDQGHKKFGYIQGIENHLSAERRYDGFLRALKVANIGIESAKILRGNFTFKSGIECAQKLLETTGQISALICANDDMAAGALFSAHRLGIKVPQDVSIVGFDDTPVSEIVWPPLTTVHQPLKKMGAGAVRLLIEKLEGRLKENIDINEIIDFSIISRASHIAQDIPQDIAQDCE